MFCYQDGYILLVNSQLPIALHILGYLASAKGKAVTSEALATSYGTNPVVLRRVLSKLKHAGLVRTKRGAGGGSVLARKSCEINLRQAYEAVADQSKLLLPQHPGGCDGVIAPILADYVNEMLGSAEQALLDKLATITVERMDRVVRRKILREIRKTRTTT